MRKHLGDRVGLAHAPSMFASLMGTYRRLCENVALHDRATSQHVQGLSLASQLGDVGSGDARAREAVVHDLVDRSADALGLADVAQVPDTRAGSGWPA